MQNKIVVLITFSCYHKEMGHFPHCRTFSVYSREEVPEIIRKFEERVIKDGVTVLKTAVRTLDM